MQTDNIQPTNFWLYLMDSQLNPIGRLLLDVNDDFVERVTTDESISEIFTDMLIAQKQLETCKPEDHEPIENVFFDRAVTLFMNTDEGRFLLEMFHKIDRPQGLHGFLLIKKGEDRSHAAPFQHVTEDTEALDFEDIPSLFHRLFIDKKTNTSTH